MSAETNSVVPAIRAPVRVPVPARGPAPGVSGRQALRVARPAPSPVPRPAPRPVVAVLADGTPAFAPVGEVVVTGTRVICHLCGRALRSVPAHLRVHGYTKEAYCLAFGLERGQSLEGPDTRKLRSTALASRLVFDLGVPDRQRRRAAAGPVRRTHPGRGRRGHRPPPPGAAAPQGAAGAGRHPRGAGGPGQRRAGQPSRRAGRGGRGPAARLSGPRRVRPGPAGRRGEPGGDQPRGRAAQGLAVPPPGGRRPPGRPLRYRSSGQPGQMPGGGPRWTGWDSLMCPATCRNATSGSTGRSTPWPPRSA